MKQNYLQNRAGENVLMKSMKHPYHLTASVNGHVTLQIAISADGNVLAPPLILKEKLSYE